MSYTEAKKKYAKLGVDTEKAMAALAKVPVALHLWQGNDVEMFDVKPGGVSGGIQATGNYPGRARNPQELMDDLAKVIRLRDRQVGGPRQDARFSFQAVGGFLQEAQGRRGLEPNLLRPSDERSPVAHVAESEGSPLLD